MNETKQQSEKTENTPVISPLVNDQTYGERWYHGIVDWGLSYWTNLSASAGFSQWAEHGTKPVKWLGNQSPREWQAGIAKWFREKDPFMKSFGNRIRIEKKVEFLEKATELVEKSSVIKAATNAAEGIIFDRSMARARSFVLLLPGFLVMIPTVWLAPKIKPWFVEKMNRHHYGDEAMTDPTMIARQQAIAAEERPTLLGTVVARLGTVVAAQTTAQLVGSKDNIVNKLGKNVPALREFGVDPLTEKVGTSLGAALPDGMKARFNNFAGRHGLEASEAQKVKHLVDAGDLPKDFVGKLDEKMEVVAKKALKPYSTASEDLGRFIAADTFYTAVTALTIQPIVRLLRRIPFMSYKPKVSQKSAQFEGEKIKVPANQYTDYAEPDATTQPAPHPVPQGDVPGLSVNDFAGHGKLQQNEQQIA